MFLRSLLLASVAAVDCWRLTRQVRLRLPNDFPAPVLSYGGSSRDKERHYKSTAAS